MSEAQKVQWGNQPCMANCCLLMTKCFTILLWPLNSASNRDSRGMIECYFYSCKQTKMCNKAGYFSMNLNPVLWLKARVNDSGPLAGKQLTEKKIRAETRLTFKVLWDFMQKSLLQFTCTVTSHWGQEDTHIHLPSVHNAVVVLLAVYPCPVDNETAPAPTPNLSWGAVCFCFCIFCVAVCVLYNSVFVLASYSIFSFLCLLCVFMCLWFATITESAAHFLF